MPYTFNFDRFKDTKCNIVEVDAFHQEGFGGVQIMQGGITSQIQRHHQQIVQNGRGKEMTQTHKYKNKNANIYKIFPSSDLGPCPWPECFLSVKLQRPDEHGADNHGKLSCEVKGHKLKSNEAVLVKKNHLNPLKRCLLPLTGRPSPIAVHSAC